MTTRRIIWLDPRTCTGVDDAGRAVAANIGGRRRVPQLVDYLNTAHAHCLNGALRIDRVTVYLVGARPVPPRGGKVADWLLTQTPGWSPLNHYMDADRPVGRFQLAHDTSALVDVRRAAELFGDIDDPATAAAAWELVSRAWRDVWGTGLLTSLPASGRIALQQCGAADWPAISDDTAELIRNTAPQHRIEYVRASLDPATIDAGPAPAFVYLDARWSYVALLRELHVGEPEHLIGEVASTYFELNPYDRARYRVRFKAPADWQHVGVLLAKHGDGVHWHAPRAGDTWCDSAELFVARAHGWQYEILEGMVWDGAQRFRALDTWRDRMMRVADTIERFRHDDAPAVIAARNVVRSIILQTLGAMHSRGAHNVVFAATASDVPAHLRDTIEPRGTGYTYIETVPLAGPAAVLAHPEITAQIWGRAHARILDHKTPAGNVVSYDRDGNPTFHDLPAVRAGALNVPPQNLIAIHGDALYLTEDPRWPDDGKIGRMRVKGRLPGPIPWPQTMSEVYRLARKSEATQ